MNALSLSMRLKLSQSISQLPSITSHWTETGHHEGETSVSWGSEHDVYTSVGRHATEEGWEIICLRNRAGGHLRADCSR